MKKIIIAIDGYSSTGKSTLAKSLANLISYKYIDTGAMYRVVTLFALQNGMIVNGEVDVAELVSRLDEIEVSFQLNTSGFSEACLNHVSVEKEIRGMQVSSSVSKVSTIPQVRSLLVAQQQFMGKEKGVVMDGRDIGSVVFPEAELKLFMTASEKVRVERRLAELLNNGENVNFEQVKKNLLERDYIDSNRAVAPLLKVPDALILDNSLLNKEEQLDWILDKINELNS